MDAAHNKLFYEYPDLNHANIENLKQLKECTMKLHLKRQLLANVNMDVDCSYKEPYMENKRFFWSKTIKSISDWYGYGVSSYFSLLQFLLILFICISFIYTGFLMIPQMLVTYNVISSAQIVLFNRINQNGTDYNLVVDGHIYNASYIVKNRCQVNLTALPTSTISYFNRIIVSMINGRDLWYHISSWYSSYKAVKISEYDLLMAYLAANVLAFVTSLFFIIYYFIDQSASIHDIMNSLFTHMVYRSWNFSICTVYGSKKLSNSIAYNLKILIHKSSMKQSDVLSNKLYSKIYAIRSACWIVYVGLLVCIFFVFTELRKFSDSFVSNDPTIETVLSFLPSFISSLFASIIINIYDLICKYERYSVSNQLIVCCFRFVLIRLMIIIAALYYIAVDVNDCFYCWENVLASTIYNLLLSCFIVSVIFDTFLDFIIRYIRKTSLIFAINDKLSTIIYMSSCVWIGMFYAPILPLIYCFVLLILFYHHKICLVANCTTDTAAYNSRYIRVSTIGTLYICFIFSQIITAYFTVIKIPSCCGPFGYEFCVSSTSISQSLKYLLIYYVNDGSKILDVFQSAPFVFIYLSCLSLLFSIIYVRKQTYEQNTKELLLKLDLTLKDNRILSEIIDGTKTKRHKRVANAHR